MLTRAACAVLVILSVAGTAAAFDGIEHCQVSNAALSRAKNDAPPLPAGMVSAIEALSGPKGRTFGDLTEAVDWFQDITKLTDHDRAWSEIGRRKSVYFWQGVALHRNDLHFQSGTLCVYKKLHEQAVARAAARAYDDALYFEAVALHFLQDFLAAGHFVTPRGHLHDAVAGSLHDHFNRVGVEIEVTPPPAMSEEWKARKPTFPIRGDGSLDENPAHRALLVMISAMSVKEVLVAASRREPRSVVRVCFEKRWAERDPAILWRPPLPGSRRPPDGRIGISRVSSDAAIVCYTKEKLDHDCESFEAPCSGPAIDGSVDWLATYRLPQDVQTSSLGLRHTNAVQVAVARDYRTDRWMWSIGAIVHAPDPRDSVAVREKRPEGYVETGAHFPNRFLYSNLMVQMSSITGDRYRALGVDLAAMFDVPHTGADLTLYGSARRYQHGAVDAALDYGAKIAHGFDVGNVSITVEHGREVDASGRLRKRFFVMPGAELTVSFSWFQRLFRRDAPRCCEPPAPIAARSSLPAADPSR